MITDLRKDDSIDFEFEDGELEEFLTLAEIGVDHVLKVHEPTYVYLMELARKWRTYLLGMREDYEHQKRKWKHTKRNLTRRLHRRDRIKL